MKCSKLQQQNTDISAVMLNIYTSYCYSSMWMLSVTITSGASTRFEDAWVLRTRQALATVISRLDYCNAALATVAPLHRAAFRLPRDVSSSLVPAVHVLAFIQRHQWTSHCHGCAQISLNVYSRVPVHPHEMHCLKICAPWQMQRSVGNS